MKKDEQTKMLIELHHAIIGNGTKGLSERVSDLEEKVNRHNSYMLMAIGGGMVVGFLFDYIINMTLK